jgi:hypothetical protein
MPVINVCFEKSLDSNDMGLAVDVGKLSLVAKPIFTVEMTTPAITKKGLVPRRPLLPENR